MDHARVAGMLNNFTRAITEIAPRSPDTTLWNDFTHARRTP